MLLAVTIVLVGAAVGVLGVPEPASAATTITVNVTADTLPRQLTQFSLRKAINRAVADGQDTTIRLQAGVTYDLTRCNAISEDDNATGDLDVADHAGTLTIQGNGATIRQTCAGERVLDLADPGVVLRNLTVTGGTAAADIGDLLADGGGIRSTGGVAVAVGTPPAGTELTLDRVQVEDNRAEGVGGGISAFERTAPPSGMFALLRVRIFQTEVTHNTSARSGGGIAGVGPVSLVQASVVENTAAEVGGVAVTLGVTLSDATVADSTETPFPSPSPGNAVELDAGLGTIILTHATVRAGNGTGPAVTAGDFRSRASVIDGHLADSACGLTDSTPTSEGSNADDDGTCGFTGAHDISHAIAFPVDSLNLGPLADNGGPTRTIRPNFTSALVDNEPASACGTSVTDQRGVARPVGEGCDTGAVELVPRADALLRPGPSGDFLGNDVYDAAGQGQAVVVRPRADQTVQVTLRLQNDGERFDRLRLRAPGSTPRFTVTYTQGHTDRTAAVVAGTYTTPKLAIGGTDTVTMTIRPRAGTPAGTARNLLAVVASTASTSSTDAVGVTVRVVA